MDGWKNGVLVLQNDVWKNGVVPDGVLGGYCHGMGMDLST
jgi:hypothetical protein